MIKPEMAGFRCLQDTDDEVQSERLDRTSRPGDWSRCCHSQGLTRAARSLPWCLRFECSRSNPLIGRAGTRGGPGFSVGKWFGMAEVNGVLLASNNRAIYRRVDVYNPRWVRIAEFPPTSESANPEIRGLTAYPTLRISHNGPSERCFLAQGKL